VAKLCETTAAKLCEIAHHVVRETRVSPFWPNYAIDNHNSAARIRNDNRADMVAAPGIGEQIPHDPGHGACWEWKTAQSGQASRPVNVSCETAALPEAELVGADMVVNPEYRLRRGGDGADGAAS